MKKASVQEYAQALFLAVQETGSEDHEKVVENLVDVLKTNEDLDKYEAIIEAFEALLDENAALKEAEVAVGREGTLNKRIMDELNTVAGDQLSVKTSVDETLVGGVVIRVGDEQIDASIKGKLEQMKNDLSE